MIATEVGMAAVIHQCVETGNGHPQGCGPDCQLVAVALCRGRPQSHQGLPGENTISFGNQYPLDITTLQMLNGFERKPDGWTCPLAWVTSRTEVIKVQAMKAIRNRKLPEIT